MRRFVDRFWSDYFRVLDVHAPGVMVAADPPGLAGRSDVRLVRLAAGSVVIGVPLTVADAIRDRVAQTNADDVFTAKRAELVVPGSIAAFGPSRHAYLAPERCRATRAPAARRLTVADEDALAALRSAAGEEDWLESGFARSPEVAWGILHGSTLVVAGHLSDFAGHRADVGLLTHPAHRNRHLATELAAAMITSTVGIAPLIRYRALTSNAPSIAVAATLGFVGYGEDILVRAG